MHYLDPSGCPADNGLSVGLKVGRKETMNGCIEREGEGNQELSRATTQETSEVRLHVGCVPLRVSRVLPKSFQLELKHRLPRRCP